MPYIKSNSITLNGSGASVSVYHTGLSPTGAPRLTQSGVPYKSFEVLLSPEAIDYQVIPEGIPEPRATADATVNYTIEETVNGTVFLVTRTKFPDGSTMVINSVPKP